ncbi:unnamed protein product [Arctia plantaginis]|uniref:CCHC-type domain-containing protein n=1 Tax=Arctia plantaginis TaxID=874455 RepID=A0A8S1AVL4_ARCPL|nr:unnamed protein product [Arctia plantaginis]
MLKTDTERKRNLNGEHNAEERNKEYDAKARSLIVQCIPDRYLDIIKDSNTAGGMLKKLDEVFQRKSVFSKLHLRRKLLSLKLGDNKMGEYLYKFESLIRELENLDKKVDEEDKICYLLMGLPESYNTVITAIETISEKVTLDFVKTRLLDEELKKVTSNTQEPETIFTANVECYRCYIKGHIARNCKKNNFRGRRMRGRATGHSANYVTNDKWSVIAINNELECNIADLNNTIKFIIDSGATENIIKEEYENCMHNIKELDHTINIKMANGNIMEAKKSGEITIKSQGTFMNIQCIIVPGIAHNLLSVKKMSQKGLQVLFSKYGLHEPHMEMTP